MAPLWEYHKTVRRLFPATVALSSLVGIFLFFSLPAAAQINAPPTSVTSPGFGGRSVNGPPASVTSVGPRGYAPGPSSNYHPGYRYGGPHPDANGRHRNRDRNNYYGPYMYAYPVPYAADPYAYDNGADMNGPDLNNDESDYQGGPTVFDRRGSGARSYIPPVEDAPPAHHRAQAQADPSEQADSSAPTSESASATEPPSAPTTLIFKDGHQLEIGNYAIVGSTLFDLTPGHPRKIPLAELNLDATQKQNEDHGVVFQLPPSVQGS